MDETIHPDEALLIHYLDGELDETERASVESRLASDPEFSARLEGLRMAALAVQQYGARKEVANVHRQMMAARRKTAPVVGMRVRWVRWTAIAAALVLVVAGTLWYQGVGRVTPEKLYAAHFVDYKVNAARGATGLTPVADAYNRSAHTEVITSASSSPGLASEDSLLVGLSYLKLDQPQRASFWFAALLRSTRFRPDAQFYLALTQIREQRYDEALRLLRQIQSEPGHVYGQSVTGEFIREVEQLRENR
jgi:hypothetical protein